MAHVYVSMVLALTLTGYFSPGGEPVGMVIHADRAHVGEGAASVGTTLFDGDHLTTEEEGELGVRSSAVTLQLEQETSVTLGSVAPGEKGMALDLASGTLVFASAGASAVVVRADGAVIRKGDDAPTMAHVRVVGPKELRIFAQRGRLEFAYRDEREVILEGACYQVLLDADEGDNSSDSGSRGGRGKKVGLAHRSFIFVSIAVGSGAVASVARSHRHHPHPHESPDRP
jgi:hypothetical protein